MKDLLKQFIKDILTGRDGESYDLGRVLGAFGFVVYVLIGVAQLVLIILDHSYHEFPFVAFGGGFTAIGAGTGALIWMKKDTEPAPDPEPPK